MTGYLISFEDGAMTSPDEHQHAVAKAAHEVVDRIEDAGAWVIGGGVTNHEMSVVGTDGSATAGPCPGRLAVHRWILDRRHGYTPGGAGVGCTDRRRLSLCEHRHRRWPWGKWQEEE